MIVGPIQAQMDDFCDLHGTPDTPVSRIVTVKIRITEDNIRGKVIQQKSRGELHISISAINNHTHSYFIIAEMILFWHL